MRDAETLCKDDPISCLVQLSAKSSADCQLVLTPSLFGSCLGDLPECAVPFKKALTCLSRQVGLDSDCAQAVASARKLQESLPQILIETFEPHTRPPLTLLEDLLFGFAVVCLIAVGVCRIFPTAWHGVYCLAQ